MLVNALLCTLLVALVASSVLSAGLAMTRAAIHRAAATYIAGGYQRGAKEVQDLLTTEMQSGALPSPLPTLTPAAPQCADPACRYSTAETIQFTTVQLASPSPACDGSETNCAGGEEANGYVNESRVTARITVSVTDASGTSLAAKSTDVTFRTLRRAPYVVLAGFRDAGFDDVSGAAAAGDDGGLAPSTPNPCGSVAPGTSDDTAVRVAYQNAQTSACTDGSAFRTQSYSQSPDGAPGWSP